MKNTIIYILLALFIFIINIASLIAQEPGNTYENRDKVESNISKYKPAFFDDKEFKHLILFFDVKEGRLILSDRDAKIIRGKMPYVSNAGGQFHIISKNREGKVFSDFYIQDPTKIRLNDGDEQALQPIENAKDIQIVIPYDAQLKSVEFIIVMVKERYEFDISSKIKNLE